MSGGESRTASRRRIPIGSAVEVRSRFDSSWSSGFEVVEVVDHGYRVLRRSDGSILPTVFSPDEVRREHRRETWWI